MEYLMEVHRKIEWWTCESKSSSDSNVRFIVLHTFALRGDITFGFIVMADTIQSSNCKNLKLALS